MWTLWLCVGISWGGCGSGRVLEFPTKQACLETLATIRTLDDPKPSALAEGSAKRSAVAMCYPKESDKRQ